MHNLKVKSTRLKVDPFCEFKRNIPRLSLIMLYPFAASGTRNSGFSLFGAPPVETNSGKRREVWAPIDLLQDSLKAFFYELCVKEGKNVR